jgi:ribosomal protein S18 acetylase RimI-like enzyme
VTIGSSRTPLGSSKGVVLRQRSSDRAAKPRLRQRSSSDGHAGVTDGLDIRSARSVSLSDRAELFNVAYDGYLIPFHVTEATLASMDGAFDLDLGASKIAYRDGEAVGLGNLGVRGDDAWIGGVGVVPDARREGIGEALMRALHGEARERSVRRVWLEVIVENASAFALYEKLGYRTVRDVEVWSLPLSVNESSEAEHASVEDAHARIRELRTQREPWQRADGTLAHYGDLRGLVTARGAAVYRQPGDTVQLVQIAGEAEPLLRALRTLGPVSVLNVPEDDPATTALRALGASVAVRQHEMMLDLAD